MRSNTSQIRTSKLYFGQHHYESAKEHNKITPKQRQLTGKGGLWAKRWVDHNAPMETYVPAMITPPRG